MCIRDRSISVAGVFVVVLYIVPSSHLATIVIIDHWLTYWCCQWLAHFLVRIEHRSSGPQVSCIDYCLTDAEFFICSNCHKMYKSCCDTIHRVSQKTLQNCFRQNCIKFQPILIIFGRKMSKRLELRKMHSLSTWPKLRRHTYRVKRRCSKLSCNAESCYLL